MMFEVQIKKVPLGSELGVVLTAESKEDRSSLDALVKHMSDSGRPLKINRVCVSSRDKTVFEVTLEEVPEPDPAV